LSFDPTTVPPGLRVGESRRFQLVHPDRPRMLGMCGDDKVDVIATEFLHDAGGLPGFVMECGIPGGFLNPMGWFEYAKFDRAEWYAWGWLLVHGKAVLDREEEYRQRLKAPPPELPRRRGLLWHLVSGARGWFHDGL
jgi:hypothetical protein